MKIMVYNKQQKKRHLILDIYTDIRSRSTVFWGWNKYNYDNDLRREKATNGDGRPCSGFNNFIQRWIMLFWGI